MFLFLARLVVITASLLVCTLSFGAQKLTVILDWFPNPNHGPLLVAQAKGYFAQNGLTVSLITPSDPTDPPKWLAMGKGDMAIDYQPQAILSKMAGLPIRQIGTLIDQPLNSLVWLQKPQEGLKSLRGQHIAYSAPEIDLPILKFLLRQQSLTLQDVTAINVHYNLMQALLSGQVTAAIGLSRNIELTTLRRLHPGVFALYPEHLGIPVYSELVFVAKESTADRRYSLFFEAINKATHYIRDHPEESWQDIIKFHSELNTADNHAAWLDTVPKFCRSSEKIDVAQQQRIRFFLSNQK
jgi:putative hydroxymethylpyrimidine transport system substrate-binding protein